MSENSANFQLGVAMAALAALLSDGRGNSVVIRNPASGQFFVHGYLKDEDRFFLIPVDEGAKVVLGEAADRLVEGLRVEVLKDQAQAEQVH